CRPALLRSRAGRPQLRRDPLGCTAPTDIDMSRDMTPSLTAVQYRKATMADVPGMAHCRLADPAAGVADPRMAAYMDGHHHPQQALGPRVVFVALVGTTVVGYIGGHLKRRYQCDGQLQYLFVAPQYRRTGIASELFRLLAGWFAHEGGRKVGVNVEPGNGGARALYPRHGAFA